jgi:protein TonB
MLAARTHSRFYSLLPVAALHVAALLALSQAVSGIRPEQLTSGALTVFFIQPTTQTEGADAEEPKLTQLAVLTDHPLDVSAIGPALLDLSTARNSGATMSAPTLKGGTLINMAPYNTQAGLLPGEGATVILRIEVLANGEPGRMAIDVSSGSQQVDTAAMDYARQLRWFAGRTNEKAEAMWIRWSVRLQG